MFLLVVHEHYALENPCQVNVVIKGELALGLEPFGWIRAATQPLPFLAQVRPVCFQNTFQILQMLVPSPLGSAWVYSTSSNDSNNHNQGLRGGGGGHIEAFAPNPSHSFI